MVITKIVRGGERQQKTSARTARSVPASHKRLISIDWGCKDDSHQVFRNTVQDLLTFTLSKWSRQLIIHS